MRPLSFPSHVIDVFPFPRLTSEDTNPFSKTPTLSQVAQAMRNLGIDDYVTKSAEKVLTSTHPAPRFHARLSSGTVSEPLANAT